MLQKWFALYKAAFEGLSKEIWYLALVLLINRTGAMVLPFMSVYVTKKMGATLDEAAYIIPFYGVGSFVGAYLGGWLTNRIGSYWTQVFSLILSGIMFFIWMQMDDIFTFTVMLCMTSMAMDIFRPANMAAIGEYAPREKRAKAVGLIRLAVNVGYSLGPVAGGLIAGWMGYSYLFVIDAWTCWVAALVFISLLKKPNALIQRPADRETSGMGRQPVAGQSPYRDWRYLRFIFITLLVGIVFIQLIFVVPVFYEKYVGLPEEAFGFLLAMNALIVAIVEMPLIHHVQTRIRPMQLLGLGVLLMGVSYAMCAGTVQVEWLVVAMIFLSVGEILNLPFAASVILEISPEEQRGAYMGLFTMTWSVCTIIGPWLGLKLSAELGFPGMWLVMAGLSALCVLLYWHFERRYPMDPIKTDG